MPSSDHRIISWVMEIALSLEPTTILDIGCGMGKYGVLCREYVDSSVARVSKARIDCVEAFPSYIGELHRATYDNIYLGDAVDVVPQLEPIYDLGLLIDVFEHLDRTSGKRLLDHCSTISPNIVMSVPTVFFQHRPGSNRYELHRAHYSRRDLKQLGFGQVWRMSGSHLCIRSTRPVRLYPRLLAAAIGSLMHPMIMHALDRLRAGRR